MNRDSAYLLEASHTWVYRPTQSSLVSAIFLFLWLGLKLYSRDLSSKATQSPGHCEHVHLRRLSAAGR